MVVVAFTNHTQIFNYQDEGINIFNIDWECGNKLY